MKVCGRCGANNDDNADFCGGCGAFLEFEEQPAPSRPVPAPPPSVPAVPRPEWPAAPTPPASASVPPAPVPMASLPAPSVPAPAQPVPARPAPARPVAAQPMPVQPAQAQPHHRRRVDQVPVIDTGGAMLCPSCGAGNDTTRRFCRRCGQPLIAREVERLSWWRRLLRRLRGQPRRAGYRPSQRATIRPLTVVLTSLLGIAIIIGVTPMLRHRVVDGTVAGYNAIRDRMKDPVSMAPRDPAASSTASGLDATRLIDGATDTYWAPAVPAPAIGEWIEVKLENPRRVVSLIIYAGVSTDRPSFLTQARPHEVLVTLRTKDRGEITKTVSLADKTGQQRYSVKGSDVVAIRLTIKSAYGADAGRRVALAELEVFVRP